MVSLIAGLKMEGIVELRGLKSQGPLNRDIDVHMYSSPSLGGHSTEASLSNVATNLCHY